MKATLPAGPKCSAAKPLWMRFISFLLATLLLLPASAVGQFRVESVRRDPDGVVRVAIPGNTNDYYLLYRASGLDANFRPVSAARGSNGPVDLVDGTSGSSTAFYRVRSIPVISPSDTDGDGIDDVTELDAALDPLNPNDASDLFTGITSSPADGEGGVSVTRETVVYFSKPLAPSALLNTTNLYATFGGRRILSRVELSSDHRKASLFYLEPLPAGARIRVWLDGTGVPDSRNFDLDADGDGQPGGVGTIDFETLSIAPVGITAVLGRVMASDPVADGRGGVTNRPLENVTITVDGAEESLRTTTDAAGYFRLQPCPAGRFFVHVDGRTAVGSTWPEGAYYPFVGKAWEAEAGRTNNLASGTGEIFLPLVPAGALTPVSATNETVVTFAPETIAANTNLAGVQIVIPPNSLFADGGARGGRVGIAPVPPDRLPEPLPPGLDLPLVITIQTDGPQNFDRPVPVRFPNLPDPATGVPLEPGAKSALWSFNHDTGRWEIVGPMTVSADGRFVETDPGVGVLQPGWHGTQPGAEITGDSGLSRIKDGVGGVIQFSWSLLGTIGDLGNIPGLGKFVSAVNLVVDIYNMTQEPSLVNATKIFLDVASLAAPPGVDTVIRGVSTAVNFGDMTLGADSVNNSVNSSHVNSSDIYGVGGSGNLSENRFKASFTRTKAGVVRVAPPMVTFRATDYYDRSGQQAAKEAVNASHERATNDLNTVVLPLYRELDRLFDRTVPVGERLRTNGPALTQAELDSIVADASAITNVTARIDNAPRPDGLFRQFLFDVAAYQRILNINLAMASVGTARAPLGTSGQRALLDEFYRRFGTPRSTWFRLVGPRFDMRGRSDAFGRLRFIVRPDEAYVLSVYDSVTKSFGALVVRSGPNGQITDLPPVLLSADDGTDSDGDGLSDIAEESIGTLPAVADSDGDGTPDGAEVWADTNPLDNRPATTGVVGRRPLPGSAADVCVVENRAIVALEAAGIAAVDVSDISRPTVVAQVDTPGAGRRVSCTGDYVAVADGPSGLTVVDISDPPSAFVRHSVPSAGNANAVVAANGIAYVGTEGGEIVRVHIATGSVLGRTRLGSPVRDLQFGGNRLYAATQAGLTVLQFFGEDLEVIGTTESPGLGSDPLRLFIGGGIAHLVYSFGYNVFDVADTTSAPVFLATQNTGQRGWKQIVDTGSGTGVAAVSPNLSFDGPHNISLYDLRDPSTNRFLVEFETPGVARAVSLNNGIAFVADHTEGLTIVNYLAADRGTTAPSISLAASFPLNPAEVENNSAQSVTVDARDDVQVRNVEFYVDGALVGVDGNYPFEFRFLTPALTASKTNFVFQARAFDTGGNSTWSQAVTTRLLVDTTAPRAFASEPTASGFGASITNLAAFFSEEMAAATFVTNTFVLKYAGADRRFDTDDDETINIAPTYREGERTATLSFAAPLPPGRYQASVATNVTDLAGNHLVRPLAWNFEAVSGVDSDGDGLTDEFEIASGLNPGSADQNNNGIPDAQEDFDGDGVTNGLEMLLGTNPRNARTFDGRLDRDLDRDGDYLTDLRELAFGTDRLAPDTDGDGWNDEIEVTCGSDPLVPNRLLPGVWINAQNTYFVALEGFAVRNLTAPYVIRMEDNAAAVSPVNAHVLRNAGGENGSDGIYLADPPVLVQPELINP
jgi:hypothetical protein